MEKHLTSENFNQEVLHSELPVLVDFWADWCGPCRMVAPVVSALAQEYQGKLKVCKVNVDEAADIAGKYGVMSIPTFAIFKEGKVVDKFVGALPKQLLVEKVKPHLQY
ncbi:MAG: thioredoxin [Candidatus Omnitrophica bacterium]|nr:thioredoxin [Candidatus Omnitrophota bacterium]